MNDSQAKKRIVVIGGGTGTHGVLKGLKQYADQLDITAVISMMDSGGSTGRLRDEFGYLPVGDVRMALAALATEQSGHEELLRELFLHRFNKGEGLSGHNFGNLLLLALTDILGSEAAAVTAAGKILQIQGAVLPVTEEDTHICATYDDGETAVGEHDIDDPSTDRFNKKIVTLKTETPVTITPAAKAAIETADVVVLGPGDLYASLLANCVVTGMPEAIQNCAGTFIYVGNLMSRPGQTRGMNHRDYVAEVYRYVGRAPDMTLINNAPLPESILATYQAEGDTPVVDDLGTEPSVRRADVLDHEEIVQKDGDVLTRSLLRHSGAKVAKVIMSMV